MTLKQMWNQDFTHTGWKFIPKSLLQEQRITFSEHRVRERVQTLFQTNGLCYTASIEWTILCMFRNIENKVPKSMQKEVMRRKTQISKQEGSKECQCIWLAFLPYPSMVPEIFEQQYFQDCNTEEEKYQKCLSLWDQKQDPEYYMNQELYQKAFSYDVEAETRILRHFISKFQDHQGMEEYYAVSRLSL